MAMLVITRPGILMPKLCAPQVVVATHPLTYGPTKRYKLNV